MKCCLDYWAFVKLMCFNVVACKNLITNEKNK